MEKYFIIDFTPQEKIDTIHEQVIRGELRYIISQTFFSGNINSHLGFRLVRGLLDKKGWANARDHYGHSPLHKTVMANQEEIMRFILERYPDHVEDRDNVSSTMMFMNTMNFMNFHFRKDGHPYITQPPSRAPPMDSTTSTASCWTTAPTRTQSTW